MSPKFLIRLDDAHHCSNQKKWKKMEEILIKNNVFPIVAVIPNNKDKTLNFNSRNAKFWEQVKIWEQKGWTIALHGHTHTYHKINKNCSILPMYPRSEFSGLSLDEQIKKMKASFAIFKKNNLIPKVFVAPSHSFDENTLKALKKVTSIRIVSDGWSLFPYFYKKLLFVPQQCWDLKFKLFGIWTVCLHPNTMREEDFEVLDKKLKKYSKKIISLNDLNHNKYCKKQFYDHLYFMFFLSKYWLKIGLKCIVKIK